MTSVNDYISPEIWNLDTKKSMHAHTVLILFMLRAIYIDSTRLENTYCSNVCLFVYLFNMYLHIFLQLIGYTES